MGDAVKSRVLSSHGLAHIKAELVKSKLENRRSRTSDGTPIAYSTIKDDTTLVPERTTGRRESRSYSDPDIPGSLVIFSEANGLFSNTNQVSSFKGKPAKINITSEEKQSGASKQNFKSTIDQHSTVLEPISHQQHMPEFSNLLHIKGNQPRFRKGGGVLPQRYSIAAKPVMAPSIPSKLSISAGIEQETSQAIRKEDSVSNTPSKLHDNDDDDQSESEISEAPIYAQVDKSKKNKNGAVDDHSEESLSSKQENDKESEMYEAPIYAQVEKSKKKSTLSNINQAPSISSTVVDKNGAVDDHSEESLSSKQENDKESEMYEAPIYAQVDKSKKKSTLSNINQDDKLINRQNRSESDPSPSGVNVASGVKFEVLSQVLEAKQSSAENKSEAVISDEESDGWDPDEFDDDDDDSSEFELSSDLSNSRSNSQGETETMNFPDERSKKLYNIAREILTTERAYVRRLYLLDQVFYFRLQNECLAHGHITPDVLHDVFSNIAAIHSLHKDFLLPKLEERMSQWGTDNRIGDILKTLAPFLKIYTAYIANFDKSSETLSTWTKKSPKFASIIEDVQKSKECENLTLGHHMLEPVQRVPRYKLLLRDYLAKLPEDSPDYKDSQDAMVIISEAAAHANDSMKKTDSFKKLLEFQERVMEDYDIITAGRQFIKEGDLTKVSARHVAHQERTLLLFNDILLCCAKIPGTNKLKVKVEMDLYGMEIGEADEDVEFSYTFRVTSKQKVIDFSASSEDERETWVKKINDAVQEIARKRETYKRGSQLSTLSKSELGKKAPAWVRDEAVTMCMLCDSLFTLTKRRHHCRACGGIYCNNCCHFKVPLEYANGKHERVCQTCHGILVRSAKGSIIRKKVEVEQDLDLRKISHDSKVLLSGYLSYKGGDKSWVKRWCVLSDTFEFYCYKAKKDTKAGFSVPLPGYVVDKPNMADGLDKKIAFKLHHKNVVVHYFATDKQEALESWMHHLSYAVKAERIPEEEPNESQPITTQS